jgi:hypothetical protein
VENLVFHARIASTILYVDDIREILYKILEVDLQIIGRFSVMNSVALLQRDITSRRCLST